MLSDHPPSEVHRLRQAIAELQDERDKYRHNASKAMREAKEFLVEKERLKCENADLKRTMRGLKEDIQRRAISGRLNWQARGSDSMTSIFKRRARPQQFTQPHVTSLQRSPTITETHRSTR